MRRVEVAGTFSKHAATAHVQNNASLCVYVYIYVPLNDKLLYHMDVSDQPLIKNACLNWGVFSVHVSNLCFAGTWLLTKEPLCEYVSGYVSRYILRYLSTYVSDGQTCVHT